MIPVVIRAKGTLIRSPPYHPTYCITRLIWHNIFTRMLFYWAWKQKNDWLSITHQCLRTDVIQTPVPYVLWKQLHRLQHIWWRYLSASMCCLFKRNEKRQPKEFPLFWYTLHTDLCFGPLWCSLSHQCRCDGLSDAVWMCVGSLVCSGRVNQSGLYAQISLSATRCSAPLCCQRAWTCPLLHRGVVVSSCAMFLFDISVTAFTKIPEITALFLMYLKT